MAVEHDLGIRINVTPGTSKNEFKAQLEEKFKSISVPIEIKIDPKEAKRKFKEITDSFNKEVGKINNTIGSLSASTNSFGNITSLLVNKMTGNENISQAVSAVTAAPKEISKEYRKQIASLQKEIEQAQKDLETSMTPISTILQKGYSVKRNLDPDSTEQEIEEYKKFIPTFENLRSTIASVSSDISSSLESQQVAASVYSGSFSKSIDSVISTLSDLIDLSPSIKGVDIGKVAGFADFGQLVQDEDRIEEFKSSLKDLSDDVKSNDIGSILEDIQYIGDQVSPIFNSLDSTGVSEKAEANLANLQNRLSKLTQEANNSATNIASDIGTVKESFIGISKDVGTDAILAQISTLQKKLVELGSLKGDQAFSFYMDTMRKSVIDLQQSLSAASTNFKVSDIVGDPETAQRVSELLSSSVETFKVANVEISKSSGRSGLAEGIANMSGSLQNAVDALSAIKSAASGEDVTLAKSGDAIASTSKQVLEVQDGILKALANMSTAQRMYNIEIGRTKAKLVEINEQITSNRNLVKDCITDLQKFNTAATISTTIPKKEDIPTTMDTGKGHTIKITAKDVELVSKYVETLNTIEGASYAAASATEKFSESLGGEFNSIKNVSKYSQEYSKMMGAIANSAITAAAKAEKQTTPSQKETLSISAIDALKVSDVSSKADETNKASEALRKFITENNNARISVNEFNRTAKESTFDTSYDKLNETKKAESISGSTVPKITKTQIENLEKASEKSSQYGEALSGLSKIILDFIEGPSQKLIENLKTQHDSFAELSESAKAYVEAVNYSKEQTNSTSTGNKISNKQVSIFAERLGSMKEVVGKTGSSDLISQFDSLNSEFDKFQKSSDRSLTAFTALSASIGALKQKTANYAQAQREANKEVQDSVDYSSQLSSMSNLATSLKVRSTQFGVSDQDKADSYAKQAKELQSLIEVMQNAGSEEEKLNQINAKLSSYATLQAGGKEQVVVSYKSLDEALKAIISQYREATRSASEFSATVSASRSITKAKTDVQNLTFQIRRFLEENQRVASDVVLSEKFNQLLNSLASPSAAENVGELRRQFASLKTEAQGVGLIGDGLLQKFKELFSTHFGTMLTMNAIHLLRNSVYQAYQSVVQIDDAMTQLQIVTRANTDQMNKYAEAAASAAKSTASSITETLDSATTYARLGFRGDDPMNLAKYTSEYANTSGSSVSDATTAVTAILKGYNKDAKDVENILSELVKVGNDFPISASELGEGLANAGSSLQATGNTLEESIGILTAANASVQNISKSSTMLRTISARLTGTQGELQQAAEDGLDVEDAIENQSKYRDEILAETNGAVDILEADGKTYKNTFTILKDLSNVWTKLDSSQKAVITNDIAGTRGTNVFNSIMSNFGEAENAAAEASDSLGALSDANAIYMDSITAHTTQFQTEFQTLSKDFINTDLVKFVIDLGTGLLTIADNLTKIGAALPAVAAGFTAHSQLGTISKDFKDAQLLNNSDITPTKAVSSYLKLGKDSVFNNVPVLDSLFGSNSKYITRTLGFKVNISNENEVQELANYFSTLSAQEQKAARGVLIFSDGMEDAFNSAIGKTKTQTAVIDELASAQERSARIMLGLKTVGTMALVAGVTYLIQKAFSYAEEQAAKLQAAASQANALVDANETKRANIKDLVSEYEQLGKSESGYVSNIETARSIQNQITEAIGDQADGLDLVNGKYDAQLKKLKEITTAYSQSELSAYTEQVGATSDLLISKFKGITYKLLDNYAVMQTTIRGQRYGQVYGSASGNDKRASEILNAAGFSNRFSATSIGGGIGMGNYNFSALGVSKNADAEEIVAYYYKVSDAIDALMNSELGASATSTTLYKSLALTRDGLKEYVSNYESAVKQQMTAKAVNQVASDMSGTNISTGSDFVNYIQEIQSSTQYSDEYKQVLIDTARNAMPQFASAYQDMVDKVAEDDLGNYLKAVSVDSQEAFNELWEGVQDSKVYTDDERAALESLIIETFPDFAEAAGVAADANDALANSSVSVIDMTSDEFKAISDNLDSVQNAYKTLSDAVTEYNDNGYMSIDTLQSVLSLGDNYLRYLIDENGQLSLNEEGLVRIANARLDELETKALENAESLVDSFSSEATAADYLANSLENLAHSRMDDATALLAHQSAILAGLDPASSEYRTKKQASDMVIKSFSAEKGAIEKTRASLGKYTAATMGAASASKSLADSTNAAADAAEKEQNRLKIYGQAAVKEIEKRIDKLNDEKDAFEKDIQSQIDNLNKLKDAQDKAYEDRIDVLNDEKDALGDKNDEEDRAIKLAQLQQALAEAQSAKTKRMYVEGQGYIWTADQSAIDDAQKNLDDQIRQNARDDATKAIEDEIDAINKEKDAYDDSIAAQIDDLNNRKDAFDANIQDQVDQLNALKDKYQEAIDLIGTSWDDYQTQLQAAAEFSKMSYDQMTSYSTSFKDQVVANMQAIKAASDAAAAAQAGVGSGGGGETKSHGYRVTLITGNVTSAKDFNTLAEAQSYADRNRNRNPSVSKFASGSLGVQGSQWGITQEAGNELIVRRPNVGQYTYLEDGDGVIPADITSRLFDIGANPSSWFAKELSAAGAVISKGQSVYSITTGNIIIEKPVGSADDLASAIKEKFPSVMLQMVSKR